MTTIPDSLRNRIQKLLALANDGRGNENEAQAAAAKVQTLLAEYNLEMSQIIESDEDEVLPDAVRQKVESAVETVTQWQAHLFGEIAENNFVCRIVDKWLDGDRRSYHLVGRRINIDATLRIYAYLTATIDRLCPFTDKRTKAHRSWKEGCADRLRARLQEQRLASERASRDAGIAKTANGATGSGSDLVLSDVYSSESDLNRDFARGVPAGTTARERAANEARWKAERAAREATAVVVPERVETEAQRRRREAKDKADNERYWKKYRARQAKEAARRDPNAYAMGANAGSQISLDQQIGAAVPLRKIA